MKVEDLTIKKIIETAKKYKGNCTNCPFYSINTLPCDLYCDCSEAKKKLIENDLKEKVVIEDE